MMHVTIAIPTRRRLISLEALLLAIERQRLDRGVTCEVAVVDNDAEGSAWPVVATARQRGLMRVSYTVEAVPGIAAARNQALAVARGDALAFIDDDEVPGDTWLMQLVRTMQQCQADLVFAPVVPAYGANTAAWIKESKVFERRRLRTGQPVDRQDMRTGNVLIALDWLRRQQPALAFDNRLGLTGGEDSLFFALALDRGVKAVWCDDAAVTESVPDSRANARYLLRRYFQIGISSCAIESIRGGWMGKMREALKGSLLIPTGLVLGTMLMPLSSHRAAIWYAKAICGAGKVAGAFGHRYELYATATTTSP